MKNYLSNAQLKYITNFLPKVKTKPFTKNQSHILNLIIHRLRTGSQWRQLCNNWEIVYYHFQKWIKLGVFKAMLYIITNEVQLLYFVCDTQSIKNTNRPELKGYDGNKKVAGIKRIIITNQFGEIVYCKIFPANVNDSKILSLTLQNLPYQHDRIVILADRGFIGTKLQAECNELNIHFTPMKRKLHQDKSEHRIAKAILKEEKELVSNFNKQISKKRFVVERSFAWLQNFRLLNLNYERKSETHEAMVLLASVCLKVKRY